MADDDAIIIGAGHNGLICALYLARAGFRVTVFEAADEVGGGLRSAEVTRQGFIHDRYATNFSAFAGSPISRELAHEFSAHGVALVRGPHLYAGLESGHALRVYADESRTEQGFSALSARDAKGWRDISAFYRRAAPRFLPMFGQEMPSREQLRLALRLVSAGPADAMRLARLLRQSSGALAADTFPSAQSRALLTGWAYHLDFAPDTPGGAIVSLLFALSASTAGMPIVQGGAGRLAQALRLMAEAAGVRIVTRSPVARIVVRGGRASGVKLTDGREAAAQTVIANVTTRHLFGRLLSADDIDSRLRKRAQAFRYGPGTFIIHLALSGPAPWRTTDDLASFNYVHLNGGGDDIANTHRAVTQGLLPARPLLVISQPSTIDPSRAPAGQHVMRIHVRTVPAAIAGDACGVITEREWTAAKLPFADRILDLVEREAPGLRALILGLRVESPLDIEQDNSNFIDGDCVSGSHRFAQNYWNRPLRGWSRYATPVRGLYMIGASTWPGGGINGGSGYLLARKLCRSA